MFQGLTFEPFALPPEAEELRSEVREFLVDSLDASVLPNSDFNAGDSAEFSRALGKKGWIGITWPKIYGGLEKSFLERYVITEELLAAGAPVGCHWIADRQTGPLFLKFETVYVPLRVSCKDKLSFKPTAVHRSRNRQKAVFAIVGRVALSA